jgi:hypothetical protein
VKCSGEDGANRNNHALNSASFKAARGLAAEREIFVRPIEAAFAQLTSSNYRDFGGLMKAMMQTALNTRLKLLAVVGIFSVFLLGSTIPSQAQDAAKPQEPEYTNSFFYLDSTGALKPLEREPVGVNSKIHALGFGGVSASYQIQGDHSPVRFAAGSPIQVIVKLENHDADPATQVLLYSLQSGKGNRQILITRVHYMGLGQKSDLQTSQLQMAFAKYGQGSTEITTASPLPPGEYALAMQTQGAQPLAFCFGVDGAK